MKKLYYFWLSVLVCLLSVTSCRKLVQDEIPLDKQEVTVNSAILYPDSSIVVYVSLTYAMHELPPSSIDNATVLVKCNDSEFKQLNYNSEKQAYEIDHVTQQGDTYICKVYVPGFDTVYSQQTIPYTNKVTAIKYIKYGGVSEDGINFPSVEITFDVNNDTIHYYEIVVYDGNNDVSINNVQYDKVILAEGLNQLLFSNKLIDTNEYTIRVNLLNQINKKVSVELRALTPDFYRYRRSFLLNLDSYLSGSDLMLNNKPCYSVYSNVLNGRGSFVSYASYYSDTLYLNNH